MIRKIMLQGFTVSQKFLVDWTGPKSEHRILSSIRGQAVGTSSRLCSESVERIEKEAVDVYHRALTAILFYYLSTTEA